MGKGFAGLCGCTPCGRRGPALQGPGRRPDWYRYRPGRQRRSERSLSCASFPCPFRGRDDDPVRPASLARKPRRRSSSDRHEGTGGAAPSASRHAFHLAALVISAALPKGWAVIGAEAMETKPPDGAACGGAPARVRRRGDGGRIWTPMLPLTEDFAAMLAAAVAPIFFHDPAWIRRGKAEVCLGEVLRVKEGAFLLHEAGEGGRRSRGRMRCGPLAKSNGSELRID